MLSFVEICPSVRTPEDGPFGTYLYYDDKGFSAVEWASIPPIPTSMKGVTPSDFNHILKKALESMSIECNFNLLNKEQKEIVTILYSGYGDCQEIALKNWLDETNQKLWSRLNWDVIETSFIIQSDEWIKEELEWAKSVGVTFKKNWEYKKPSASWTYMGRGYLGANWFVRNIGQE